MPAVTLETIPCGGGTEIQIFYCEGTPRPYGVRLFDTQEDCVVTCLPIYRCNTLEAAKAYAVDQSKGSYTLRIA